MRPEMYEYQYDWMLSNTMRIVTKATRNSPRELEEMFKRLPYFSDSLRMLFGYGPASKAFAKFLDTWLDRYFYNAEELGFKRAMTTFIVNPLLFHAMKIAPLNCELISMLGNAFYQRAGFDFMDHCVEEGFTETSCAAQRATLGAYLAGLAKPFDVIVINSTGTCDANANAFAFMANRLKKPFYAMDYPYWIPGEEVTDYTVKDMKAMISFVEHHTSHTVDYERLEELLDIARAQEEIIVEIQELMTLVPCPLPAFCNFMLYVGHLIGMGIPEYTELLTAILGVGRKNLAAGRAGTKSGKEKARIYAVYIDHYNTKLNYWNWFDACELSHVGSIAAPTFYERQPYVQGNEEMGWGVDTSSPDGMIRTVAELGARQPMARSIRGPFDAPNQWLDETLTLMKLYKADCGVFQGTYGCRNTWSNVQSMANELERHGYPTLICTADAVDERPQSWEQSQAQIEEFLAVREIV
jgi:hypothetical protein